jgi:hypothetical protein
MELRAQAAYTEAALRARRAREGGAGLLEGERVHVAGTATERGPAGGSRAALRKVATALGAKVGSPGPPVSAADQLGNKL